MLVHQRVVSKLVTEDGLLSMAPWDAINAYINCDVSGIKMNKFIPHDQVFVGLIYTSSSSSFQPQSPFSRDIFGISG